jgi:hypothetical protein
MRLMLVPLMSALLATASAAQTADVPAPALASLKASSTPIYTPPRLFQLTVVPEPRKSGFFSHITIESFGVGSSALPPGYAFSEAYFSSLYNLQGLECRGCALGPTNLTHFTLPPFGATTAAKLDGGRVELFAGFAGINALKPDGTVELHGQHLGTSLEDNAWLTQAQAGFRVAIDSRRRVWLGATGRRLYDFGYGPGPRQGNTVSGDATFRLGR